MKELERRYDNIEYPDEPPRPWGKLAIIVAFCIYIFPGFILLNQNKEREKMMVEYDRECERVRSQKEEILEQARNLCG